ncbi:hypothetical protein STEG23_032364, partial [Scotinomys teguina]
MLLRNEKNEMEDEEEPDGEELEIRTLMDIGVVIEKIFFYSLLQGEEQPYNLIVNTVQYIIG